MDAPKLRIMAGIAGVLFALAGVVGIGVASILALSALIGPIWGALVFGVLALGIAGGSLYVFILPNRSTERELDDLEDATAKAIVDLPFATLRAVLERQPLLAVAIAGLAGYSLTREPEEAVRHAQRLLTRFL